MECKKKISTEQSLLKRSDIGDGGGKESECVLVFVTKEGKSVNSEGMRVVFYSTHHTVRRKV